MDEVLPVMWLRADQRGSVWLHAVWIEGEADMQLLTFDAAGLDSFTRNVYLAQAERLRCEIFEDGKHNLAVVGDKFAIHEIVERLAEDKIEFTRFIGLDGRLIPSH